MQRKRGCVDIATQAHIKPAKYGRCSGRSMRPVIAFDDAGEQWFEGMTVAATAGYTVQGISQALRKGCRHGGRFWRYDVPR